MQCRSNLVFTFHCSTFVFPGKYSILRQSFALFFITLGSSLLYKPANFQSHLLTQTERHRHRQAGHKNALGNISKQWQGFLVVKKKVKKKSSLVLPCSAHFLFCCIMQRKSSFTTSTISSGLSKKRTVVSLKGCSSQNHKHILAVQ